MDRIFYLGPRLGNIAQKGPKMALNRKIELLLQEDRNFDFGPRFGNMALKPQNGPKFENRTPPSVLELGLCNFQNILT